MTMKQLTLLTISILVPVLAATACGSDDTQKNPSFNAGAGGSSGGSGGSGQTPYDCVLEPTTHLEIINACTDAVRIEKHPDLPAISQ
jgi:hypothetical protein